MNYVKNLDKIYYSVEQSASAVCSLVGEKPQGTLVPISDKPYVLEDFTTKNKAQVDECIKDVVSNNGFILDDEKFFLGVWTDQELNLNIDVCVAHKNMETAFRHAIIRGIPHLIVTENVRHPLRVPVPSPQTAGTNSQQVAYATTTARQIVNRINQEHGSEH